MTIYRAIPGLVALLVMSSPLATTASQQTGSPGATITVVDPPAGGFLVGAAALRVAISPEDALVTSVEFFVDGVLACKVEKPPYACNYDAGDRVAAHLVRAIANLASGGRVVETIRTRESYAIAETTGTVAVLVPFVVKDYRDRFVKGLTRESLRVYEDGALQRITAFEAEDVPIDVVIAIDVSGSMDPSMPKLKIAVNKFLEGLDNLGRLNRHVNVTVIAFNDRAGVVVKPDSDLAARKSAVAALRAGGGTALYDAILTAIGQLGRQVSHKAILVFTDGDDRDSLASIEPVESRIRETDVAVYMITQGKGPQMEAARKIVNQLSEKSGGRPFTIEKIDQLDEILRQVMDDLTNLYLIGYSPTNSAQDGTYRKIVVKTPGKLYDVRARDGYRAPLK